MVAPDLDPVAEQAVRDLRPERVCTTEARVFFPPLNADTDDLLTWMEQAYVERAVRRKARRDG